MTKKQRCGWCEGDPLYEQYHDTEWGVPLFDDQKLLPIGPHVLAVGAVLRLILSGYTRHL